MRSAHPTDLCCHQSLTVSSFPLHIFQGLTPGLFLSATSMILYSSNTPLIIMHCLSSSWPQSHSLSSLYPPIPKPVLVSHLCLHFIVFSLGQPRKLLPCENGSSLDLVLPSLWSPYLLTILENGSLLGVALRFPTDPCCGFSVGCPGLSGSLFIRG